MPDHDNAKASLIVEHNNNHYEEMSRYFYDLICLMGSEELDLGKVKPAFLKFKEAFQKHLNTFDRDQQAADNLVDILSKALKQQFKLEDKKKIICINEMGLLRLPERYELIAACVTDDPEHKGEDDYLFTTALMGASGFFWDSELGKETLTSFKTDLDKGILELKNLESTLSNQNEKKIVSDLISKMNNIKDDTENKDIPVASRYLNGVDAFQKATESSLLEIQKNNNTLSQKIKNIVDTIRVALGLLKKKPDNPFSNTFLFGQSQKNINQTYEDIATPGC